MSNNNVEENQDVECHDGINLLKNKNRIIDEIK